jgi:hypothetical protein
MIAKTMIPMNMKKLKTALIGGAVTLAMLLTPLVSFASSNDNAEKEVYDARLEVYPKGVTLDAGGPALTYFLLLVLAGLCLGVLFKNANRSHLD